jgi:hypothetical protein
MRASAERVDSDAETFGHLSAPVYFGSLFVAVVSKYYVPASRVEPAYAHLKARGAALLFFRRIGFDGRRQVGRLFDIFKEDIVRDFVEIQSRVAHIVVSDFDGLASHAIYRFISQFFGDRASAPREYANELASNLLVFLTGVFAVRVEPGEEIVESFLG